MTYELYLPAGSAVRLTATARPQMGRHRWDVRVLAADGKTPRLAYGSRIGGSDRVQHIDIPAQDVDCTLVVGAHHAAAAGWEDDRSTIDHDTPSELRIGFCDPASPAAHRNDVLLSFAFGAADDRR